MASGYHTLKPSHVEAKVVRVAHVPCQCMCFDAEFDCRKLLRHNIFQHRVLNPRPNTCLTWTLALEDVDVNASDCITLHATTQCSNVHRPA